MSKMCPECLDPAANSLPAPDLLVRDEPDEDEDEDYDGGEDDENEDDEEDDGYSE